MVLGEEPHAMDVLQSVPYVLEVHRQGLTSMKHNQYTGVMFVQVAVHPSNGSRFIGKCKTTTSSSVWIMLLHKEPQGH